MAVTENSYTGNGSTTNYSFTFPYLKATDIEVQVNASVVTNWSLANATTVQFNSAPSNGDKIKILRQTSVDELAATFYAGSAIKSEDLNDNYTQNLYKTQEVGSRFFSNTGGTMTGDLTMAEDTGLIFEGATDDAYETTLGVVDPTADRAINLPNEDGTLIVSSSTSTVNVGSKDIHTTGDIDLVDDGKIKLGANDDLQLYHNGTDSRINNRTGHLTIQNTSDNNDSNIYIKARDDDNSIICNDDGSVELYYDNIKKFETSGSGATVTGVLTATVTGDVTGDLTGNADTATTLQTARTIGGVSFNGSANINLPGVNTGGNQDTSGNASTATALATARTLGGVSFDGTANINLPGVNAAGNQNTSGNAATATALANARTIGGVSFDGTANINLPGVNAGGNQDTSGNAATATAATALATSRDFSTTGEVTASAVGFTGAGNVALSTVISSNIVDEDNLKISNSGSDGQYLQKQSGNAGGLTWASPGGGTATAIATVNEATDTTCFPLFGTSATGDLQPKTNANLTFNSNTGAFTAADISVPNDSGKVTVGTSADLSIYHNGSNSYIDDSGTGNLFIRSNEVRINKYTGEYMIKAVGDGAVELYHDNVKTFATSSTGVDISNTGEARLTITGGEGGGANIYLTADEGDDNNDKFRIRHADGALLRIENYESGAWEDNLKINGGGAVELYYDNVKAFETSNDGVMVLGPEAADARISLYADEGDDDADKWQLVSKHSPAGFILRNYTAGGWEWNIAAYGEASTDLYYDNSKKFETTSVGVKVTGNYQAVDGYHIYLGTGNDLDIYHDGTYNYIASTNTTQMRMVADEWRVRSFTGSETLLEADVNGAVKLYHDNTKVLQTTSTGVDIDDALHIYNENAHDAGHIMLRPRSTTASNNQTWIGVRDTPTSNYRFTIDGDGEVRSNSTHFAGVQRNDDASPTNWYNSSDRIRYHSFRGTSDHANIRSRAVFGTASSDWDDFRVLYYVDAQADAALDYDQDQTVSISGSGRIQGKHSAYAGRVESDEATVNSVYAGAERGFYAYADDGTDYTFISARNVADASMVFHSQVNGEVNVEIEADGSARTDGTWSDSNADYAECFEWTDGNSSDQERRGMTVVLDGEKVKLATDSDNKDNIIGVVSSEPVVLGDAAPLGWHGRYKKDAYGSPIRKEQEWLVWKKEYHYKDGVKVLVDQPDPSKPLTLNGDIDRVRVENIEREKALNLIPDFAITNNIRYKTYAKDIDTTNYDSTKAYIPRKDRKEWDAIGMVGKLVVRRGQPVGTRWLLMKQNIGTDTDGTVLDRYLVR